MGKGGLQATFFYAFSWRGFEPEQEVHKFAGSKFERRPQGDGPEGAKGRMPGVNPLTPTINGKTALVAVFLLIVPARV